MIIGVNALFMIPGEVGGSETYLRRTLAAAAHAFPRHEFVVFANHENRNAMARDLKPFPNVTLVDMRVKAESRARRALCEQTALPKVVAGKGIEVLWNPGNTAPLRVACPQATSVYDMQFMHFPEDFSRTALFFTKLFTRLAMRRSQAVLTISEFSRQEIARYTRTPFDAMRVTLLAADESYAKPLPGEFIAERVMALLHSGEPYILVVANTYPHKSVETAVRAFSKLCADIPHRLVLLGKPRRGEDASPRRWGDAGARARLAPPLPRPDGSGGLVPGRGSFRLSLEVRGLRPARAGGDERGRAGGDDARGGDSGSRRGRGCLRGGRERGGVRGGDPPAAGAGRPGARGGRRQGEGPRGGLLLGDHGPRDGGGARGAVDAQLDSGDNIA